MRKVSGFNPIDESARQSMADLAAMSDESIDFSDIPEWDDQAFKETVPFLSVFKPRKEQITTRLDADILLWLKSHGKGYQTLMNDVLRQAMRKELENRA
jgi:uncharacterized protein (DUF4415 family)